MTSKGKFKTDFGLKDQIQRAAVSIISNIAEGFDSQSNLEFQKFLIYFCRSVSEVKTQLYVASDLKYISEKDFENMFSKTNKVGKLVNGFIRYLATTKNKKTN